MPTTYTSRIRAAKLETGSNFNTWGTALNAQDFDIFDEAFGVVTIALTGVDISLTTANGATDQARNMGYRFTGTGGVIVTLPSVQAVKAVINNSNGSVTIRASVSSSVIIGAGSSAVIATNGTDTWQVASNLDAADVSQVFSATSSTSNTVASSGTFTFTLNETNRAFSPGMNIRAAVTADPAIYIDGYVDTYTGSGTTLTMVATGSAGAGTYSAWTISFAQAQVNLPPQSGQAGKFLTTDGFITSWGNLNFTVRATITSATALTASDASVVPVAMTTASQSVTLPDATTLMNGRVFVFVNTGTRDAGIRNASGQLIARVGIGLTVSVYLRDRTTAAGQWAVEGQDALLPLAICDTTLASTYTGTQQAAVRLSDTLSLHFCNNSSGHPFVFAVDSSTFPATVGTPVLIVASSANVDQVFRVSATKAFALIAGGTNYNITVSGTTCTVSSSSTAAVFDAATFTGAPVVAALTDSLYVAIDVSGGAVRAQAVDASGTNPSAGSSVNVVASGGQAALSAFRTSDTSAIAFYVDDSGTPGSPYSIRAVVLSVSGTTITVNTSAGLNDVADNAVVGQLTATSYIVGYYQASGTLIRAAHVGVSGTTVTFGTPLTVETASLAEISFANNNSSRFQPPIYRLTDTTALFTYGANTGSEPSRHVVITNSSGTLSAGTIVYRAWAFASLALGGNFPQRSDGFLYFQGGTTVGTTDGVYSATVSGTTITINGKTVPQAGTYVATESARFGLSGNYFGIRTARPTSTTTVSELNGVWQLYRHRTNSPPQYLGLVSAGANSSGAVPVEIASNKVAITGTANTQTGNGTNAVQLTILEFPA